MNQGELRRGPVDSQCVNQQEIRRGIEALHRAPHGEPRGLININPIDLKGIGRSHRPRDCAVLDASGEQFAVFRVEFLAVAQAANRTVFGKNRSGREHRPKQTTPPRFIDARNEPEALNSSFALITSPEWIAAEGPLEDRADANGLTRARATGRLYPSSRADNRASSAERGPCAPRRCDPPPAHARGKCARRLAQN